MGGRPVFNDGGNGDSEWRCRSFATYLGHRPRSVGIFRSKGRDVSPQTTMAFYFVVFLLLSYLVQASRAQRLGFEYIRSPPNHRRLQGPERRRTLPIFHLPYAKYRASSYDEVDDVYTFTNIRFAASPTGPFRFKAPQRPFKQLKIQDGSIGHSCYQTVPTQFMVARPALEGITQSEDCLFLDLFVPGYVVRASQPRSHALPIAHWIFGGGFGEHTIS